MTVKRCKVVMIPTNEKAQIYLREKQLIYHNVLQNNYDNGQHLYFLSDEEIREGDWYMNNNVLFRADDKFDEGNNPNQNKANKKMLATTDSSLIINDWLESKKNNLSGNYEQSNYLPQPSQDFIKAYIEAYNAGKPIEWIDVEYELKNATQIGAPIRKQDAIYGVKVNSKNEITIRKIKDSYSREEVIKLIKQFDRGINMPITNVDKWIEENL